MPRALHQDHALLLGSFGGVIERENQPTWWLLNHNDALTAKLAGHRATFIRHYKALFDRGGAAIPIVLKDYYCVAEEANGNRTICNADTGAVLLFATDHYFDFVTVLQGCPEYTLYQFKGAPTFRRWIQVVARQWASWVAGQGDKP
jgi:hypothetical protein